MSPTAIVAESLPLFREGLVRLLEVGLAVRVVEVLDDSDTILQAQRVLRPTLAVIDRDLPGRDVFEVLQSARRVSPHTRCVLMASQISDVDIDRALAAAVSGYVLKSDGAEELRQAVQRTLAGEFGVTPGVAARLTVGSRRGAGRSNRASLLTKLTKRELEVLVCVARGLTVKETAVLLAVSPKTVDGHKARVMAKLQIHDRVHLTHYAIGEGLISVSANRHIGSRALSASDAYGAC